MRRCRHCALHETIRGTRVCRICVWRFTQLAFRPDRFTVGEIDLAAEEHREVLAFAVTTGGAGRWVWVADDWPGRRDATLLNP